MRDLKAHVKTVLAQERLLARGDRVLLGVSGGADSVALSHAMVSLRDALDLWLGIVHVNHGLRPEAGADAAFVQQMGQRWRVPVTVLERDVATEARKAGWSLEDGARRIRYHAF